MAEMTTFARRLRERRKFLGMSQDDLSEATGATQAAISRYEAGDTSPTADAVIELARVLKTSTDWLLGLSNEIERGSQGADGLTSVERDILLIVRSRLPEQQAQLLDILRSIERFASG